MEVQQDFKKLFAMLNKHGVEFIIVGGCALDSNRAPRSGGDMDIFVRPGPENGSRVLEDLNEFGSADPKEEDICIPERIVRLGASTPSAYL